MTKREYLRKALELKAEIRNLRECLDNLYAMSGQTPGDVPDRIKLYERLIALQAERLGAAYAEIEAAISAVPQGYLRVLLRDRYIVGLKVDDIAEKEHYSPRYVKRLLAKAAEAITLPEDIT